MMPLNLTIQSINSIGTVAPQGARLKHRPPKTEVGVVGQENTLNIQAYSTNTVANRDVMIVEQIRSG